MLAGPGRVSNLAGQHDSFPPVINAGSLPLSLLLEFPFSLLSFCISVYPLHCTFKCKTVAAIAVCPKVSVVAKSDRFISDPFGIMSENAHKDLNTQFDCGKNNGKSCNGNSPRPEVEKKVENVVEGHLTTSIPLVETLADHCADKDATPELKNAEVEYIESENLKDLEDLDSSLETITEGLDSKDWILVCESLNNVRRLSLFHKEMILSMLEKLIPLVVKSLKNPRSAVCKTACMTSSDIFKASGDDIIDSLDPLLVQLLLKSSQDKRFVCEAAERALVSMTTWVSPALLLPKLQPYLKNKNPRIRAKASMCISRSVPKLGFEGIESYGIDKLIEMAATQLSDKLPDSREAARTLLLELRKIYEKHYVSGVVNGGGSEDDLEASSWEKFCRSKLSPLNAQAVVRVTNTIREGLVLGS